MPSSTDAAVDGSDDPRSDLEARTLAWLREALEDPSISTDDNFLEIGGHSLMAMDLNAWLKETSGVEVDMRQLFEDSLGKAIAGAAPDAA
ncbi:MAG: phosphopantetheine-binding protein [Actinocatenispora sp.]